jgi:Spy/CpxP family protein refolding chaperone
MPRKEVAMKHLILGTALSLATVFPAFAQDGGVPRTDAGVTEARGPRGHHGHHGRRGHGRHGDPEARLQHMTEELQLTPAQVEQLRRVFAEQRASREARREEAREERFAAREAMRARVESILTPEQRQRAQALRQTHQQERLDRRVQHLTEKLALRPNQVTQVRRILEQTRQRHEALGRGPEHREAHRALREQTRTQIEAVLDAEQRTRAQELREERGPHGRGHGPREGRGQGRGEGRGRGPQKA